MAESIDSTTARLANDLAITDHEDPDLAEPAPVETVHKDVVLDPDGDLVLVAGGEDRYIDRTIAFRVDSRALARASPVLKLLLYGPFSESIHQQKQNQQQGQQQWTVRLPDDMPERLGDLLAIAHGRFDRLRPERPAFHRLESIAERALLTDKYDMTAVLRPWAPGWLPLLSSAWYVGSARGAAARKKAKPSNRARVYLDMRVADYDDGDPKDHWNVQWTFQKLQENKDDVPIFSPRKFHQVLWVSWELGWRPGFERAVAEAAWAAYRGADGEWRLNVGVGPEGDGSQEEGVPLFKHMPEPFGAMDLIISMRHRMLEALHLQHPLSCPGPTPFELYALARGFRDEAAVRVSLGPDVPMASWEEILKHASGFFQADLPAGTTNTGVADWSPQRAVTCMLRVCDVLEPSPRLRRLGRQGKKDVLAVLADLGKEGGYPVCLNKRQVLRLKQQAAKTGLGHGSGRRG